MYPGSGSFELNASHSKIRAWSESVVFFAFFAAVLCDLCG